MSVAQTTFRQATLVLAKDESTSKGFQRQRVHTFDPAVTVLKSTCTGCQFWLTANSASDLSKKEDIHAASCTKMLLFQ